MTFDSLKGGIDQTAIIRNETMEIGEISAEKPTDKVKLFFNPNKQTLRWELQDESEFQEPTFTEDQDLNEIEVDLTGEGNGRPILGLTEENTFQILPTEESSEPFRVPEHIKKIVDLNSGEWTIKPDNQGIVLKISK